MTDTLDAEVQQAQTAITAAVADAGRWADLRTGLADLADDAASLDQELADLDERISALRQRR